MSSALISLIFYFTNSGITFCGCLIFTQSFLKFIMTTTKWNRKRKRSRKEKKYNIYIFNTYDRYHFSLIFIPMNSQGHRQGTQLPRCHKGNCTNLWTPWSGTQNLWSQLLCYVNFLSFGKCCFPKNLLKLSILFLFLFLISIYLQRDEIFVLIFFCYGSDGIELIPLYACSPLWLKSIRVCGC